ncbi:MAG TPA: DUF2846 domain-containing protein [Stellaceae bacterium]|jgi:hypothetical protein|nr:DUF2846 domain-containing protein [Stellaceae bacterium]
MRTRHFRTISGLLLAAWLGGCDTATQAVQGPVPPVPAGEARLYFYRDADVYDGTEVTTVSLNGAPTGASGLGTVFYRDVAPGTYRISVSSDKLYPDQDKTVQVGAGSTTFVKVESQPYWGQSGWEWQGNTFLVAIVDPAIASEQISTLQRTAG